MTGTEMFDAIAHIDEDLIDGCLDRMKARSSERRANAKAGLGDGKKHSELRRALIACAALAAAAVLAVGLIAVLHVGGKSPKPIGPGVTDTPAPTEEAQTLPVPADNSRRQFPHIGLGRSARCVRSGRQAVRPVRG